jgi:hypothetical protein
MKRAHGPAFPIQLFRKADRLSPLKNAEAPVAVEELWLLKYPNFADSQHAAVRDDRSEIAGRPA